ncbi:hypothetical protein F909_03590 [Acinetobacter sp. ANC 3929]|uniref:helix-turn-helix domain-containing protein n=1 Tax=Acinetobacter sp. ANC 3929 TaxID=1217707 RepID=UPI0002CFC1FC|nr:helix-turn-helix domain-containing protein [Acinetobacter sp. ANC 3929]ENW78628.1 hypothetical protein F909_03590 [Acinetobacter sp. ANC 3929]
MISLKNEIESFKKAWLDSNGHFKFVDYNPEYEKFELTGFSGTLSKEDLISALMAVNTAWGMWLKAKHEEALRKNHDVVIRSSDIEKAIQESPNAVKDITDHLDKVLATKALELSHGNLTKAAEMIGVNRGTLSKRYKEYRKMVAA